MLKCGRIYPELFAASNPGRDTNRASTSIGQWNDPPQNEQSEPVQQEIDIKSEPSPPSRPKSSPLDHHRLQYVPELPSPSPTMLQMAPPAADKLNYCLIQEHVNCHIISRQSLLLLQALRWLLTRSNTGERKVFLSSYLQSDIFGLRKKINNQMVELISSQGHTTFQQSIVRLMNAMASIKSGRDYLGNYRQVVSVLINSLVQVSKNLDQFTIDMIVATLQKLSLK